MDVLHPVCCGLDVHRDKLSVCLLSRTSSSTRAHKQVLSLSTFADDLRRLRSLVVEHGVTAVAMEATGIYWKPVYAALEGACELIVANAQHIKNVPGRKTDVIDSQWIAQLCSHGLLSPSFVPAPAIRQMQPLVRERTHLAHERATLINRLHRLLDEQGNKLGSIVSDLQGTSAREMLQRLAAGETNVTTLVNCARTTLRKRKDDLARALSAPLSEVARQQLARGLQRWELLDQQQKEIDRALDEQTAPLRQTLERLCEIPGIEELTARKIVAEIGVDMTAFATPERLASWAGVCPGNNESAGKTKSGKTRPGNKYLTSALMESAMAAARTSGTYLKTKYYQLKSRRGAKKAAMAIAHKQLKIVWHLLSDPEAHYRELGSEYLDKRHEEQTIKKLTKRLQALGCEVQVQPRGEVSEQG